MNASEKKHILKRIKEAAIVTIDDMVKKMGDEWEIETKEEHMFIDGSNSHRYIIKKLGSVTSNDYGSSIEFIKENEMIVSIKQNAVAVCLKNFQNYESNRGFRSRYNKDIASLSDFIQKRVPKNAVINKNKEIKTVNVKIQKIWDIIIEAEDQVMLERDKSCIEILEEFQKKIKKLGE